jgi:uncharacterized protein (TIGR03083 family)
MSLETAADARRIAELSRAEYEGLASYLEKLPPEGWTEQSACGNWQVYQVVSHIGSQPAIHSGMIEAGLRGKPAMTNEDRQAIWGRFDAMAPLEVFPAFRANNDAFVTLVGSLSEEELGSSMPWIGGRSASVATVLAGRLNEQVLHVWDVKWARDKDATLTPAAVPDLLAMNLAPWWLRGLAKPDRAPELHGKTIQFVLHDPDGAVALQVNEGGLQATEGRSAAPDQTVELSSEEMVLLLWGRYSAAGRRGSSVPDSLMALFPGR